MEDDNQHSDSDWQQEVGDVQPLKNKKIISPDALIKTHTAGKSSKTNNTTQLNLEYVDAKNYPELALNDSSFVDGNLAKKLRTGKIALDATLDLHGYYQEPAIKKTIEFIRNSYINDWRCVCIVTGKGKDKQGNYGALYSNLPNWLNLPEVRPFILMFCHALPKDGGQGAVYVLLRRKR